MPHKTIEHIRNAAKPADKNAPYMPNTLQFLAAKYAVQLTWSEEEKRKRRGETGPLELASRLFPMHGNDFMIGNAFDRGPR